MLNFEYNVPTKIFFGKNQIEKLDELIKPYSNILLVFGKNSVKKLGIYDKVIQIINKNNKNFSILSGVDPNPRITSVRDGIKIARENKVDLILALGGGSSIDCAKAISAGYYYENDPWDLVKDSTKITKAIDIATILTISATGSEMNGNAVISNLETKEKLSLKSDLIKPKFSILDPTYTFSVSKKQTAYGVADIISHIFESYFSNTKSAYTQNSISEALLKTCFKYGKIAFDNPCDYQARANLMWASSLALNGLIGLGKETEWTVHALEHQLSAYYDIPHGLGLAILTPIWMESALNENTKEKFYEFGVNVFSIDKNLDMMEVAKLAIKKTKEFLFDDLELENNLKKLSIDDTYFDQMAKKALESRHSTTTIGLFNKLDYDKIIKIYQGALNAK